MGDALGLHHGERRTAQIVVREALQIGVHAIEPLPQDIAVDLAPQKRPGLHPVADQQLPHLCGGDLHHPGQPDQGHTGPIPLPKPPGLPFHPAAVCLRPVKGSDPGQGYDLFRIPPGLEREKHVGAQQKPQLVLGIAFPELGQGIRRIALPCPVHLDGAGLGKPRAFQLQVHPVGHHGRHGESGLGRHRVRRQSLVGRHGCGYQQQLVQPQRFRRGPCSLHVSQVRRIKGVAVYADFHRDSSTDRSL